ncbi:hypothetical protein [Confluentibacter citreus]|uniref:hypothetical protein n=1 Tax=Confluentibacter citreus TaxID=2007307 RepID=UPI000C282866|nr:hypothetical protein [Confluentibacter citreus]
MNTKIILLSVSLFLVASIGFAQKKDEPKSIINGKISIKKYYNKEELERLQKGELLTLYTERIEALVETLPYIAFATKPGVTMATLGIPNDNDNKKILDSKFEATSTFLQANRGFQSKILPYSDTNKLISGILFYEEILKSLHEYSEFH